MTRVGFSQPWPIIRSATSMIKPVRGSVTTTDLRPDQIMVGRAILLYRLGNSCYIIHYSSIDHNSGATKLYTSIVVQHD